MGLSSSPSGDEDLPNEGIDQGTYTSTRPLPFSSSCAKEDGPAWPCDDLPSGMKAQIVGLGRRTMTKGTSLIASRERRPLHASSCTEEEGPGSLC